MIEDKLENIYLEHVMGKELDLSLLKEGNTEFYLVALLSIFSYNINQGGFAQLIYNLDPLYLEDLTLVLEIVEAKQSQEATANVVSLCLSDIDGYNEFVSGNFRESEFKNKLQKCTISYMASCSLDTEIKLSVFNSICQNAVIS